MPRKLETRGGRSQPVEPPGSSIEALPRVPKPPQQPSDGTHMQPLATGLPGYPSGSTHLSVKEVTHGVDAPVDHRRAKDRQPSPILQRGPSRQALDLSHPAGQGRSDTPTIDQHPLHGTQYTWARPDAYCRTRSQRHRSREASPGWRPLRSQDWVAIPPRKDRSEIKSRAVHPILSINGALFLKISASPALSCRFACRLSTPWSEAPQPFLTP